MKIASILLPLVLLTGSLNAAEKSPAERLLDTMDFQKTSLSAAKASFQPALEQFKKQGLPPEAIKELTAAADTFFVKTFSDPELVAAITKLYSDNFTAAELEELIKFYHTPVGKKALTTLPEIMGQAAQIGQEYAQKNAPGFQAEVQAILLKYKPAGAKGAAGAKEEAEEKDQ
ncbi:MAG: DUF2059 domain-containing protein [Luteolibacter sp.]